MGKAFKQVVSSSHSLAYEAVGHDNGISLSSVETEEPSNITTYSSSRQRLHGLSKYEKGPCPVNWFLKALDTLGYRSDVPVSTKDRRTGRPEERQAFLRELGMIEASSLD